MTFAVVPTNHNTNVFITSRPDGDGRPVIDVDFDPAVADAVATFDLDDAEELVIELARLVAAGRAAS
ncbi:hypothetical protein [Gordonia sp. NPDC003950]